MAWYQFSHKDIYISVLEGKYELLIFTWVETDIKSLNVIGGFEYGFIFLVTLTSHFLKQWTQYDNSHFHLYLILGW